MKQSSTLFLRIAICCIGAPVLILCIFELYSLTNNPVNPEYAHIIYPILIGVYVSAIPFFAALYQALKLLNYIDKKHAFSELSVQSLQTIKLCAMIISVLYVVMWPFVFPIAQLEDAPGLVIIAMVPIFAPLVIAVFAAVLQRLLKEALDIKSENDLTV